MSARRRKAPTSKAPKIAAPPEPRKMELIGLDEDGQMSLWDEGMVQPVAAFEYDGIWIKCGHYVIEWKGHAITVHCGNRLDGKVDVLFMCSRGGPVALPRAEVEAMLIGKVIPDPEEHARLIETMERVRDAFAARNAAPHRRRGRIT